jgi:hypothetical protein
LWQATLHSCSSWCRRWEQNAWKMALPSHSDGYKPHRISSDCFYLHDTVASMILTHFYDSSVMPFISPWWRLLLHLFPCNGWKVFFRLWQCYHVMEDNLLALM